MTNIPPSRRTALVGWWPHAVSNRPSATDTISAPATAPRLRPRIARTSRPAPAAGASVGPVSRRRDDAEGPDRFVAISLIPPHSALLVDRVPWSSRPLQAHVRVRWRRGRAVAATQGSGTPLRSRPISANPWSVLTSGFDLKLKPNSDASNSAVDLA